MQKADSEYYAARAARERKLAEKAPGWMIPKHTATAEHYEQLAEKAKSRGAERHSEL